MGDPLIDRFYKIPGLHAPKGQGHEWQRMKEGERPNTWGGGHHPGPDPGLLQSSCSGHTLAVNGARPQAAAEKQSCTSVQCSDFAFVC